MKHELQGAKIGARMVDLASKRQLALLAHVRLGFLANIVKIVQL